MSTYSFEFILQKKNKGHREWNCFTKNRMQLVAISLRIILNHDQLCLNFRRILLY